MQAIRDWGEKGDSPHLPERPEGCFAQMGTVPFFPRRRGISLLEVLISMFILSAGLLGVAALIPLGALALRETVKSDRTGACGRASLHDVKVRRMLNPATWSPAPTTNVFAIDPLGLTAVPALPNPLGGASGIPRITFNWASTLAAAEQVFRWHDDILFVRPSDWKGTTVPPNGDRPAGLFVQTDGSTSHTPVTAARAYDPAFSWFLTVAPAPTDPTGRLYAVSVVVCYQRVLTLAAGVPGGEHILDVTGFPGAGYGGGTVTVANNSAVGTPPLVLRENQWVLLRAGNQCHWYRIISGNTIPGASTGYYVTLMGPDWNVNPATGGSATATLIAVDGVTGVYTTTMQLDADSIWTP